MKIGFYFTARRENGGIYQYSLTLLEHIAATGNDLTIFTTSPDFTEKSSPGNYRIVPLVKTKKSNDDSVPKSSLLRRITLAIEKILLFIHAYKIIYTLRLRQGRLRAVKIDRFDLDYIFFPNVSDVSSVIKTPSVICIHDLQNLINPTYPEVSLDGQNIWRDLICTKSILRARCIISESSVGKDYIMEFYNVASDKIDILPYMPPTNLSRQPDDAIEIIQKKLGLPQSYFFYPAQMWPHKNHLGIVKAIILLKKRGLEVSVVFAGSRKEKFGVYDCIKKIVSKNGLGQNIIHVGYIDDATMSCLYQSAQALVMPTFFGPSNIPILEAWSLDCPVIYSNIRGCKEQAGDAALLCDPENPEDIAEKMAMVWKNEKIRERLSEKGRRRLNSWTKKDFSSKVIEIISNLEL